VTGLAHHSHEQARPQCCDCGRALVAGEVAASLDYHDVPRCYRCLVHAETRATTRFRPPVRRICAATGRVIEEER